MESLVFLTKYCQTLSIEFGCFFFNQRRFQSSVVLLRSLTVYRVSFLSYRASKTITVRNSNISIRKQMENNNKSSFQETVLTSLSPLLVHDSVSTLSTSNGILGFDLILVMAFTTNINHGLFWLFLRLLH